MQTVFADVLQLDSRVTIQARTISALKSQIHVGHIREWEINEPSVALQKWRTIDCTLSSTYLSACCQFLSVQSYCDNLRVQLELDREVWVEMIQKSRLYD